jgi:hypothetical protein
MMGRNLCFLKGANRSLRNDGGHDFLNFPPGTNSDVFPNSRYSTEKEREGAKSVGLAAGTPRRGSLAGFRIALRDQVYQKEEAQGYKTYRDLRL